MSSVTKYLIFAAQSVCKTVVLAKYRHRFFYEILDFADVAVDENNKLFLWDIVKNAKYSVKLKHKWSTGSIWDIVIDVGSKDLKNKFSRRGDKWESIEKNDKRKINIKHN